MRTYILAIDQGTTSSRAIVFDRTGRAIASGQLDHRQIFPKAGWVEHDPVEIWDHVREAVGNALTLANLNQDDLAAVGITNQRETAVVWDRRTGLPVYNAIVWQDTRTQSLIDALAEGGGTEHYRQVTGLPLATYFAGPKIAWILDNVTGARADADAGHLLCGTIDTWLLWNLTGGVDGGLHATDVTNASRTLLLDLDSLKWREDLAAEMRIPTSMLPEIRTSSEVYATGRSHGLLEGVPIAGILGDQQAALFGQACFRPGDAKNTYGTGNFLLMNTGSTRVTSKNGLISTVGYQLGDGKTVYALEGSIAVTGSLIQWLRDNLELFADSADVERLALEVEDNGGVYLVPAFSGLFAPHWRADARGALLGLTRFVTKRHIARAALEATAYQTREVMEAMNSDAGFELTELRVDGGMVVNQLLMQFQADQLGVDVIRPVVTETTALGAAFAAGLAVGFWDGLEDVAATWIEGARWSPLVARADSDRLFRNWEKAVSKTTGWVDEDDADGTVG
jgi:glycerol kinase